MKNDSPDTIRLQDMSDLTKTEPLGLHVWLYRLGDELLARALGGDEVRVIHHDVTISHEAAVTIAEVAHEYARELEADIPKEPSL